MKNRSLAEFVAIAKKRKYPLSEYVDEPGFEHLYVRFGKTFINGQWYERILTLANAQVDKPGKGTFTRLIERIKRDWPDVGIQAECVLNPRFGQWFLRNGFKPMENHTTSYFLLPESRKMKEPKRYRDVRIQVTKDPSPGYNSWSRIAVKGEILDGWIDKKGNFRRKGITIYPGYFKVLGMFIFHKANASK